MPSFCGARDVAVMWRLALVCWCALSARGCAARTAWTGPAAAVARDAQGRGVISVDNGTTVVHLLPIFLSLNAGSESVAAHDWAVFDYEVQQAAAARIPLLEVCLPATTPSFLAELALHVAPFPGFLVLRVGLYAPESGLSLALVEDEYGHVVPGPFYTLSDAWLARKQQELLALLPRLDRAFPGKLVAVRPTYLETGEWFMTPVTASGDLPGANGTFPWTSDAFYYGDYSADAAAAFCGWPELPPALAANCSVPAAATRLAANVGNMFVQGADAQSARAVMYTRFLAARVAAAIVGLAQTIKTASGGRLLSMFFYGYLFELGWDVPSGHCAVRALLDAPEVDILSGPYSYRASRTLSVGFQPHGPADAAAAAGKLFVHEDDTRTVLCAETPACVADPFWTARNLSDSVAFVRRNGLTAALRGNGLYYFDLWGYGWYGRPDAPVASAALWAAVSDVVGAAQRLDVSPAAAGGLVPQVLVFVDEASNAHTPVAGAAGPAAFTVAAALRGDAAVELTLLGAPLRLRLLSDVLAADFSADGARLCVLLNAFSLTNATRAAVAAKLLGGGRTVVFVHAAGLLDADAASLRADPAAVAALLGVDVRQGAGASSLLTNVPSAFGGGGSYGVDTPLAPWFWVADAGAEVLGSYAADGSAALARKAFADYTVVYSGSPGLPAALWRALAADAGVHLYSSSAGDVVEAAGNSLMVMAATTGARTLALPTAVARVVEDVGGGREVLLCTNCSSFVVTVAAREVHLYRVTA